MKKQFFVLLCAIHSLCASAQEEILKLQAETRIDYQREFLDGESVHSNSGFKGKYLNIIANGALNEHFSYSYRQRLNKAHSDQSFFDATDWVYLTYQPTSAWSFSAGKQVVGIGGYEYDRAPIDLYFCSEYWNNIPCYQLGVSAAFAFNEGRDKLSIQYCQSPFRSHGDDMYAYNLMWYGSHGWFNTAYSANLIEYMPDKFISYLALGHRLTFGPATLELDFMNRATGQQTFLFKDCSVMAELSWCPSESWNLFGKVTYDVNRCHSGGDWCVKPGTEMTYVGGGVEFYPIKACRNVRLHAFYAHSFGQNGNPDGVVPAGQSIFDVGLKWKVDLLSLFNKKQ